MTEFINITNNKVEIDKNINNNNNNNNIMTTENTTTTNNNNSDGDTDKAKGNDEPLQFPRCRWPRYTGKPVPTYHIYKYDDDDKKIEFGLVTKESFGYNMKVDGEWEVEDGPNKLTVDSIEDGGIVLLHDDFIEDCCGTIEDCDDEEVLEQFKKAFRYGTIVDDSKKLEGKVTIMFGIWRFATEIKIGMLEKASKAEAREMMLNFGTYLY